MNLHGFDVGKLLREAGGGVVASLIVLAHCLSFSALIFAGPLLPGLPAALWGFMLASAIGSIVLSLATTLPPMLAGPRNPAVAVMSVMAAGLLAGGAAAGRPPGLVAQDVLAALSLATLMTGASLWLLGRFKLGQIVRFVPYPVIGGFLAASGWLLITGGLRVATGRTLGPMDLVMSLTSAEAVRIAVAAAFVVAIQLMRRIGWGATSLPLLFFASAIVLDVVLWGAGLRAGWYLDGGGGARAWSPLALGAVDWPRIAAHAVELFSIVGVTIMVLLLDLSSAEVQRRQSADVDREFHLGGAVNLLIAPVGGLSVGFALNPSRLLDDLAARTRASGVAGGLFIGLLLFTGLDITALVPRPLLAGLLIYLGIGLIMEALVTGPSRRSAVELVLALSIMLAIVRLGYLQGVVLGFVGACLTFAFSYARVGVIRRHLTRQNFAAPVERAPEAVARLREEGGRIHVFWLSGFIFFGSSNGMLEEIRTVVGAGSKASPRRWVVLDFTRVNGIDSSAMISFVKLIHWAESAKIAVTFAGVPRAVEAELRGAGLLGDKGRAGLFANRSLALEWCEEVLLAEAGLAGRHVDATAFEAWLAHELGAAAADTLLSRFLVRRELDADQTICVEGQVADTIELVAHGAVSVLIKDAAGNELRVRRMTGRTVVGEMGFFRRLARGASVKAEEPAIVYQMNRAAYDRLCAESPEAGNRFLEFIVRTLSERVDFANRENAALL